MTAAPILGIRDVTAGYGKLAVLDRVSLHVAADEVLAVLGANGSGKSTVLKTVIGLTQMMAGTVHFAGRDVSDVPPHRRAGLGMGYVPQTRNVFAELSVIDNLRMGGFLRRRSLDADIEAAFVMFPRLRERRYERAGTLSGGERRMLSIGLTMLARPQLLLLDEPSSDLAPAMVASVFDAIRRIRSESRLPVLLVEQNVRAALALADRVCVMVRGRVALDVPTAEVDVSHLHTLFLEGGVRTG